MNDTEPFAPHPPSGTDLPVAGIELGGTKCVCTLARHPGAILDRHTVPTTRPDETLPAIAAILDGWRRAYRCAAIGIASFGPIQVNRTAPDYGCILATNKPGWSGADVLGALTRGFEGPVAFDTDVNGAAFAEMRWGAGRGIDDFAYVTVGTGVGVGLIVNGCPTRGIGHSEVGHVLVPRLAGDTWPSVCRFHDDCVEGLASGSALVSRLDGRPVEGIGPHDPVWAPIVHALAAMCHALVCTAGPLRIAIGGGVVARQPHLLPRIEAALRDSLNGYLALPDGPYVVPPGLGALAGPMGPIAMGYQAMGRMGGSVPASAFALVDER